MGTAPNSKSLIWLLVINDKKEASIDTIETTLEAYATMLLNYSGFHFVFTIIHNKDQQKRTHLHAFIELYEKSTKKALLDTLSNLLDINIEQLSLEPSNNEFLGVQYLTHKNQPEKEQYSFEEIRANNEEELGRRYGLTYTNPQDALKSALYGSRTMGELIDNIGLDDAKKYLPIWKYILEEKNLDRAGLLDRLARYSEEYCRLYDLFLKLLETAKAYTNNDIIFNVVFGGLIESFNEFEPDIH